MFFKYKQIQERHFIKGAKNGCMKGYKKNLWLLFFITSVTAFNSNIQAQSNDTISNSHYLRIGSKKSGICFGNSSLYNGIRLNLLDSDIKRINGLNISFIARGYTYYEDNKLLNHYYSKINGINLGLLNTAAKTSNGISVGLIANLDYKNNGLSLGGIVNSAYGGRSGISIGGLFLNSPFGKINGIGLSSLWLSGDTLNGIFISTAISGSGSKEIKRANGVFIGLLGVTASEIKGVCIASLLVRSESQKGLTIALINKTNRLNGVQIGLLNYAGNNPNGLKWLPVINMHFGKNKD